jgi:peptidoglycan/LPS O-acetylase OafA/YrhL
MKKSVLAIVISVMILISLIVWFINDKSNFGLASIIQTAVIIILVLFGVYVGFSRLKSENRGEPPEDELSRKILQKASSTAYYISLYMWLVIAYISDKTKLETHSLIAGGILGMAILFGVSWIIIKLRGMKDV